MKKTTYRLRVFVTILLTFIAFHVSHSQEIYKRVKISNITNSTISTIDNLGIDLSCGAVFEENSLQLELDLFELNQLTEAGISYSVLIDDLKHFYSDRAKKGLHQAKAEIAANKAAQMSMRSYSVNEILNNIGQYEGCDEIDWAVPTNWNLNPNSSPNSFGGCLTFDMVVQELDDMRAQYPNLISAKANASPTNQLTAEGRTVWMVRISDNPDFDEPNEPETLYQSLIHSREAATVMNQLYFMWYILENYATDPAIQNLVNNQALYFIPVFNPDGFVQNETAAPDGGGGQRKNNNGSGCGTYDNGIDLNRNSAYFWGNGGSSSSSCSGTYMGTAPFSEAETQIMRDFFLLHDFKIALNHHSYKNAALHAYAGVDQVNTRADEYSRYNYDFTYYNRFAHGPSTYISYLNSGNMNDWMQGGPAGVSSITGTPSGTGSGKNTLSWTPENGLSSQGTSGTYGGFWPAPSQYLPIAKNAMRMNFMAAYFSGKYAKLYDQSQTDISSLTGNLLFAVENLGQTASDFTVTVTPISSNITSVGAPVTLSGMTVLQQNDVTISYTLDGSIQPNDIIEYQVTLTNDYAADNILYQANITKHYTPTVFVSDNPDTDNLTNWTASNGSWYTTSDAYSGTTAITSTNTASYSNGESKRLQLNNSFSTSGIPITLIQFYAKWDLERSFDYVQLEGSTDGNNWTPICGRLTKPGAPNSNNTYSGKSSTDNNFQPDWEPLYDGDTQDKWHLEEVVIDPTNNSFLYNQPTVYIRFDFRTDSSNRQDRYANMDFEGFTFDDFKILTTATDIDQTITFDPIPDKYTTDPDFNVSATATSGLPVSFTILSGPATITGNTISLTGAEGTVVVRASQAGDGTYNAAPDVDQSFEVTVEPPCSGTLVDTFPYSESFETDLGDWYQDTGDNFDWTRNSGGTPTNSTGPSSASNGTWYIYTETTGNSGSAILNSPCFDLNNKSSASFSFDYSMYGNQMGTLTLQISTNDGSSWSNLWTQSGNHGSGWTQDEPINLTPYVNNYIRLRFVSALGGGARSDMAIDDIGLSVVDASITPIADCQDITITLDASGNATITTNDVNNGGSVGDLSIDISSFDCSNIGTNNVTLTAANPSNPGDTDTCIAVVTINQQAAPTPTNCWDNYVYNMSTCMWENQGSQPTEPSVECWETTSFNSSTCSWDINNDGDTIDPICSAQDITVELDGTGNATITVGDIDNGSSDNCAINNMTLSKYNFSTIDLGENTVTLTVTDNSGNSSNCNAIVTVTENSLGVTDDINETNLTITPNPFKTTLKIKVPQTLEGTVFDVTIFNMIGSIVYQSNHTLNSNMIKVEDLNYLQDASYLLKVTNTTTGNFVTEVIIKR